MSGNKWRTLKGILGAFILIVAVAGIVLWESGGRQALTYTSVYVAGQDIKAGTAVRPEMFITRNIDDDAVIGGGPVTPGEVTGRIAAVDIPTGLQLSESFFYASDDKLAPGERIFAIPGDWVYACPRTIRRGDTLYFYPVAPETSETLGWDGAASAGPEIGQAAGAGVPVLQALVAYVKDSANREVVDVTPERIDASADISTVEVVIDDAGYGALLYYAASGYRFNLMYD